MSPTFHWQIIICQPESADETYHSVDRHFYLTAQNHSLSVHSRSPKGSGRSYMSEREKGFKHLGRRHFCPTLRHRAGLFLFWRHVSCCELVLGSLSHFGRHCFFTSKCWTHTHSREKACSMYLDASLNVAVSVQFVTTSWPMTLKSVFFFFSSWTFQDWFL